MTKLNGPCVDLGVAPTAERKALPDLRQDPVPGDVVPDLGDRECLPVPGPVAVMEIDRGGAPTVPTDGTAGVELDLRQALPEARPAGSAEFLAAHGMGGPFMPS